MSQTQAQDRLIDKHEVLSLVGISHSFLYRLMADRKFPRQIKVGKKSVWSFNQVNDWITSKTK
jgi:prophage regulatory protein